MNRWQSLKEAERRAKAEEERLCQLYNCYPWEIETERKKNKHRRNEVLPYIYKHMDNGIEVDFEDMQKLLLKYEIIDEDTEGEVNIILDELSADLLEELLQLYIKENDKAMAKKSKAQRM